MSIEAMKMALEALEERYVGALRDKAIDSLRAAIEQAEEQKPVAQYSDIVSDGGMDPRNKFDVPPKRQWVNLTDEEIDLICAECGASIHTWDDVSYARAIEAKLREKNT